VDSHINEELGIELLRVNARGKEAGLEVLREAIANAVIHREYGDRFCGQSIAVDVFDDRVEVTNPGGLTGERLARTCLTAAPDAVTRRS